MSNRSLYLLEIRPMKRLARYFLCVFGSGIILLKFPQAITNVSDNKFVFIFLCIMACYSIYYTFWYLYGRIVYSVYPDHIIASFKIGITFFSKTYLKNGMSNVRSAQNKVTNTDWGWDMNGIMLYERYPLAISFLYNGKSTNLYIDNEENAKNLIQAIHN